MTVEEDTEDLNFNHSHCGDTSEDESSLDHCNLLKTVCCFENSKKGAIATDCDVVEAASIKREITYTAYGANIENTIRLIKSNKSLKLLEHKNDAKARRFFVTSYATKTEQRLYFGQTKKHLYDELDKVRVRTQLKIKRKDFMDKTSRLLAIKSMREAILQII
jgi:hypothetical protein